MKKYFFIGIASLFLSSCNIYRTITFNEDHSGHMDNKIDMSSMMSLMNENGSGMGSMGGMDDIKQMDQIKSIPGISNVTVLFDSTGIIYTSYDFTNVEALQNAMGSPGGDANARMGMGTQGTDGEVPKLKMTYKGKKFYLEDVSKKTLQKMEQESKAKSEEMGQMEMILGSSTMYTTITFPTDVKKVSYKNASVTNNRTVSYSMSLKDMFSKEYKPLTILLK